MPSLKNDILNALQNENLSKQAIVDLESVFRDHSKLFEKINSESKRFYLLKNKGYCEPEIIDIGNVLQPRLFENDEILMFQPVHVIWIPLRKTLKTFLEMPRILLNILNYVQKLSMERSQVISNIMQSKL